MVLPGPKEFTSVFYSLQNLRVSYSFKFPLLICGELISLSDEVLINHACAIPFCVQSIFERFDRDRSGKIDASELRDALLSLGYSVSPTVLDLLVSKFDKTGGMSKAVEYDNFIE